MSAASAAFGVRAAPLYPELSERLRGWAAAHPTLARRLWLAPVAAIVVALTTLALGKPALALLVAACAALPMVALLFIYRPALVFAAYWVFTVVRRALAAMAGSGGMLQQGTPLARVILQSEDVLALLFVLLVAGVFLAGRVGRPAWLIVAAATATLLTGGVSALLTGGHLSSTMVGAWESVKIWTCLLVAAAIPWRRSDLAAIYPLMLYTGLIVAVLGLVDFLAPHQWRGLLSTDVTDHADFRAYRSAQSIFPNPGRFSFFMSAMFAIAYGRLVVERRRRDLVWCLVFFAAALLSLRLKGLLSIAAVIVILPLVLYGLRRIRLRWALAGLAAILAGGLAVWPVILRQAQVYSDIFGNPRGLLYLTSWRIALDRFPLGAGFGRFASYPSIQPYSSVYYQYGLSQVYGLSPQTRFYLLDTSWPALLGEAGWLGLAAYLVGVGVLFWTLWRMARTLPQAALPAAVAMAVLIVVLVDSMANNTLFDGIAAATLGMVAGPVLAGKRS